MRPLLRTLLPQHRLLFSTTPPSAPPANAPSKLKKYAALFADKPVSYFTSFIILHEITAIVPVAGLFCYIHSTQWTPPGIPNELIDKKMEFAKRWTADWGLGQYFEGDKGARMLLECVLSPLWKW